MLPGIYDMFQHWGNLGAVWIISDLHFSESEEESGLKDKPTDDEMVAAINKKVGGNDTLIILGDVGNVEPVKRLRGYKVLIKGNHDKGKSNYLRKKKSYKFSFHDYDKQKAIETVQKQDGNKIISVEVDNYFMSCFIWTDNQLFDEVYEGPLFIGEKLLLSHEPIVLPFVLNIHGHTHNLEQDTSENRFCVCCDKLCYEPLNLTSFLKKSGKLSKIDSLHRMTIDTATNKNVLPS